MNHARHRLMAGLAVWFVGCGAPADSNDTFAPADWVGVWAGTLTTSGLCADRSSFPRQNIAVRFTFTADGSTLNWVSGCGEPFTAAVRGNSAILAPGTCPPVLKNGRSFTLSIVDGTLVLSRTALQMNYQARVIVHGPPDVTCTTSTTGRLMRTSP